MTISRSRGKLRSMLLRLCVRAPRTQMCSMRAFTPRSNPRHARRKGPRQPVTILHSACVSHPATNPLSDMRTSGSMSAAELRASLALAGIFGLRMLGMFIILPVFALYAEQLRGGGDHALIGLALGAYGLT